MAVLMPTSASSDERGMLVVGLLAGVVLGSVEWAHARYRSREPAMPASPFLDPRIRPE